MLVWGLAVILEESTQSIPYGSICTCFKKSEIKLSGDEHNAVVALLAVLQQTLRAPSIRV
jgi:hypothetical protein